MARNFTALKSKNRQEWLDIRRKGIGGSDISAILGLNKYASALDVYNDKLGLSTEKEENEAMYFGTLLEDVVAKEFQDRTGMKVQKLNATLCVGEGGWMRANIDRAIVNPEIAGNVRAKAVEGTNLIITTDTILECKTAGMRSAQFWGPSQELEIVTGEVTSEHEIPIAYELQVQWYMAITGAKRAYVAVLIGGQEFRCYEIDRNNVLISHITQFAHKFWVENVLAKNPPEPQSAKDAMTLYPESNGNLVEADNDVAVWIGDLRNLSGQIKELETQYKDLQDKVQKKIGQADGFTIGGEKAVTWKSASRTGVDSKKLKEQFPEAFAQCQKTTSYRTFKIF